MRKLYSLLAVLVIAVTSVWAESVPYKNLTIYGLDDESVTVAHDENNIATVVVERDEIGTIEKMTVSMPEQYQMSEVCFYCYGEPTCFTNNGSIMYNYGQVSVNELAGGVPSMSLFIDQAGSFTSIQVTYRERDVKKDGVADFYFNVKKKFYIKGVVSALFDLDSHVVDRYKNMKISVAQGYAITGVSFDLYGGMITASAGTFDENGQLSNIPENTTEITIGSLDFANIGGMQVYYDKVAESESEGSTAIISGFDDGKFVYSDDPVVVYVVSGDYLTDYNNGYYADVNVYGDYYITGIECDVYNNDYMASGGDYGNPDYSYYYWSPVVRFAGVTASLGFVSTDDNKTYKITDIPEGATSVRITAEEYREFYVSEIRVSYAKKQVSESTPTAVGKIGAMQQDKVVKTIENGKVVIIRNGEKYDLSGVRQ